MVVLNQIGSNMKYYFFIKSWDNSKSNHEIPSEQADAVALIERMYERYLSNKEHWIKNEMHHEHELGGTEETIFSVDLEDDSMSQEIGRHTVTKISAYDNKKRRHTSFVYVFVCSEEDVRSFELIPGDIQSIKYYGWTDRPKGRGLIKMTHIPTKISVSCRDKEQGLSLLKVAVMSSHIKYEKIRRYTFDPYQKVIDERTGAYTEEIGRVIDGELDLIYDAVEEEE